MIFPGVNPEAPLAELKKNERLFLDRTFDSVSDKAAFKNAERLTLVTAAFVLELFGEVSQQTEYRYVAYKGFLDEPIYTLYLPAAVPVLFTLTPDCMIEASFATPESRDLFQKAVAVVKASRISVAQFVNVDAEGFERDIRCNYAEKHNVCLIKGPDHLEGNCRTFNAYVLPLKSDLTQREKDRIEGDLERRFFAMRVRECAVCGKKMTDSEANEECVIATHDHVGEREPLKDGSMEKEVKDRDGNTKEIVEKWSCCGVVIKGSIGCITQPGGDRHLLKSETESKWNWEEINGADLCNWDKEFVPMEEE